MIAQVHIRSQHSRGSSSRKFGGPDTYVAVTVAENAEVPYCLNHRVLRNHGIEIHYFGEGYREHTGPKSMLGRAIAAAKEYADKVNAENYPLPMTPTEKAEADYAYTKLAR